MLRVRLDENNDIPIGGPKLVDGIDSVATGIRAVLSTQAGEWPYDFTFGTPWRDDILMKFFDAATTQSIIAARINTLRPEIEPVTPNQITIDTITQASARQANITVDDVTVDGQQVDLSFTTQI